MTSITIRALATAEDIDVCAQMMAQSEPWLTLRRDYQASKQTRFLSRRRKSI